MRRGLRSERGSALVELALVLPLFLVLVLAIVQFGLALNHYLALTDAVRAGARAAAVSRFAADPAAAAEAAVRTAGGDLLGPDLEVAVTAPGGWERGTSVTVAASYPYEINLLGLVVGAGHLESDTTERIE